MNMYQRPITIKIHPKFKEDEPNGFVSYENINPETGLMETITKPIWINKINLMIKGMNFHTHRYIFRQLQNAFGFIPDALMINTVEGVRVFKSEHHRAITQYPDTIGLLA